MLHAACFLSPKAFCRQASFLEAFAADAFTRVSQCVDDVAEPPVITFGTMCSGSEIPATAVATAAGHIKQLLCTKLDREVNVSFSQVFLCELDDDKRAFAMGVLDGQEANKCCAFKDIKHMCKTKVWCYRHKRECPVPRADGASPFGRY